MVLFAHLSLQQSYTTQKPKPKFIEGPICCPVEAHLNELSYIDKNSMNLGRRYKTVLS